jgi:hypothetical protein
LLSDIAVAAAKAAAITSKRIVRVGFMGPS